MVNEETEINLSNVERNVELLNINKFILFLIDGNSEMCLLNSDKTPFYFRKLNIGEFDILLKNQRDQFLNYNKNSLFILRSSNYIEIKKLFSGIEGFQTSVGRGGSQKSHVLSPLEFRLSTYLMAMFNFNSTYINSLNAFNYLGKERYLLYFEK
uniref:Uncharacterized protein n=1 Tax=Chrysoporthe deuterocubensis TaxID=764597 RepID=A0A191MX10_9PEZI|nr:hypothetical protein [Chrysoporthe deuterocubensis]AMX22192.1 hypothetical protein [Chrysoporthe deuterocubensis]